MHNQTGNKTPD